MFILERFCDFLDTANDSGLVFGDYEKDEITRAVLDFRLWTLDFRLRTLPLSAFQFSAFQLFPRGLVVPPWTLDFRLQTSHSASAFPFQHFSFQRFSFSPVVPTASSRPPLPLVRSCSVVSNFCLL